MSVFGLRREAEARAHEATAASDRGDHAESSRLWSEAADLRQASLDRFDARMHCLRAAFIFAAGVAVGVWSTILTQGLPS